MGKKATRFMLFAFILTLIIIAGCGGKSQEKVTKKIEGALGDIDGYKVEAKMTMKTGQEERSYDIDIWYKKDKQEFYRVTLESEEEDGGQVILKNEEGVFVLTPSLNKSFKFQTDWPENSSQPYLYQSLINDVIKDKEATFTANDSHYVFQTKTNYQNSTNLPFQEVYFDKKSYLPIAVKILDKDKKPLVEVTFQKNNLKPSFVKDDFKREAILENAIANSEEVTEMDELVVMYPLHTVGSELTEKKEVELENGERVIMTFKGDKNFTLIQEKKSVLPASVDTREMAGEVVNLGHSIGALSSNALEWSYNGTDFYLASEEMTVEELIEVATSIQGKEIK